MNHVNNLKSKICSTQFIKDYIIFNSIASGTFAAGYAIIYSLIDHHKYIKPELIDNTNNDFAISLINFNIVIIRIPMYFVCGTLIGGASSVVLPVVLPLWGAHNLWKTSSSASSNEIKE
jgi:hypothetical protein